MTRSLSEDLENPYLFTENDEGAYTYATNEVGGRTAYGSLYLPDEVQRDAKAQQEAGGDLRRGSDNPLGHDDGGHLIGARFGGSTGLENLTAQDSNLNRGSYKRMENEWASHLQAKDKVFVNVETAASDRPYAYMGYAIYESPDGKREYETFMYPNENREQQDTWQQELDAAEASNYWADEEAPLLEGEATGGGALSGMDADEVASFNAAWDEQLVTPVVGMDDGMGME